MSKFFDNLQKNKENGIFISGDRNNGEYKEWYSNDQLFIHCFFKNGKLNGEYKEWHSNGMLWEHYTYKDGKIIKNLLDE